MQDNQKDKKGQENGQDRKVKQFFSKYGFYMLMLVCVAAIGASAFISGSLDHSESTDPGLDVNKIEAPSLDETTTSPSATASPSASPKASESAKPSESADTETDTNADVFKPTLQSPLEGEIIGKYEVDKLVFNETMNMWATHNGIDIGAEDNAKVVAAMSGEVEKIDQDSSKICTVTLKHANDQKTIYNGLSSVSVKEGDKVSAGQELGIVGVPSFEAHDGLHLHFEYMIGNEYKNPEQFIAK